MTRTDEILASQQPLSYMKACLFNLVIYAKEEKRASYLQQLEQTVLERFPCRIIFIQHDSTNPKQLDVAINSQQRNKTNKKFNYDEIFIRAGTEMLSRVPFLVIPNLVPDLPIYLLWGQDPSTEKEILPRLENYASRLIFDSECSSHLKQFATDMIQLMKNRKTGIMDLNWATISGWRDALASVFDTPDCLNLLKTSPVITIVYNKHDTSFVRSPETKAIYLQSWLAARLGWKFVSTKQDPQKRITTYKNSQGETTVTLVADSIESLPSGAIVSFNAVNTDCDFQIQRKNEQSKVIVHTTRCDRCELPYALSLPDIKHRSTFMTEIFFQSINGHYHSTLEMMAQGDWE